MDRHRRTSTTGRPLKLRHGDPPPPPISSVPPLSCRRKQARLQPSLLLVWGGSNLQPAYPEAAIFNATALSWTLVPPLLQARSWSGAAASSDGRAFAVGGMSLVPFFDPMPSVEMCARAIVHRCILVLTMQLRHAPRVL
jgi:hypothetical protein